jgi:hypothetical protein
VIRRARTIRSAVLTRLGPAWSTLTLLLVTPRIAEACATCISSPFGDRTYSWPYLMLIVLPLAVAGVIGGVMMRVTGARFSDLRPWLSRIFHPDDERPGAREEERT